MMPPDATRCPDFQIVLYLELELKIFIVNQTAFYYLFLIFIFKIFFFYFLNFPIFVLLKLVKLVKISFDIDFPTALSQENLSLVGK